VKRILVPALSLCITVALTACAGSAMGPPLSAASSALVQTGNNDVPFASANAAHKLCPAPTAGSLQCFGWIRTDVMLNGGLTAQIQGAAQSCPFSQGYCAIDLQDAYNLPSLTKGVGAVVAIVDAYNYPHANADLAIYRKTMGLRACDTKTKCLRIVNQNGNPSPLPGAPPPSQDWRGEQSLDLDMVSAICPNCKIILVEANNNNTKSLYTGVKTAGHIGAKYIGNSWGGPESGGDNPIFRQAGVVITAAAGDNGGGGLYGGPSQPCTYTYVVCVGGTYLVRTHNKRGWSEDVWNDFTVNLCGGPCGATGSGCSTVIAKPSWQNDTGCRTRSAADVSADASLRTPVIVYNSEEQCSPPNCWFLFGGTSASTQIIAAAFALAGNASKLTGAAHIWIHHKGNINDVIKGNNIDPHLGVNCASRVKYICHARAGFDGPTGWGTPYGVGAL